MSVASGPLVTETSSVILAFTCRTLRDASAAVLGAEIVVSLFCIIAANSSIKSRIIGEVKRDMIGTLLNVPLYRSTRNLRQKVVSTGNDLLLTVQLRGILKLVGP